jgi:hypothetical protein
MFSESIALFKFMKDQAIQKDADLPLGLQKFEFNSPLSFNCPAIP